MIVPRGVIVRPAFFNSTLREVTYLEIPKCASTSIRDYLGEHQFDPYGPKYPVFTVIRNPYDRFISGFHELVRQGVFDGDVTQLVKKIHTDGFFDRHIVPQTVFLEQFYQNYADIEIYTLDSYVKRHDIPVLNVTKHRTYVGPWLKYQIRKLYRADFDLIDSL